MEKRIIFILVFLLVGVFFMKNILVSGQQCLTFIDFYDTDDIIELNEKISFGKESLCTNDKSIFESKLKDLLSKRKELLIEAIKGNPAKALLVKKLPDEIIFQLTSEEKEELIEKRGEFDGELEVIHYDDFDNPENSKFSFYLFLNGKRYQLYSIVDLPVVLSGTIVKVKGIFIEDVMAVDSSDRDPFIVVDTKGEGGGAGIIKGETPNENIGEQRTMVIVVDIGNRRSSIGLSGAERIVFREDTTNTAQDYYDKNSYGQVFFSGDVFGKYRLDSDLNNNIEILDASLFAAQEDISRIGKTFSDYDRIVIYIPSNFFNFAGLATLGKKIVDLPNGEKRRMSVSWILSPSLGTLLHELGHNFGVHHANEYLCYSSDGERLSFSYDCESEEYGDRFSTMGIFSNGHHNAPHKYEIGWINENQVETTIGRDEPFYLTPLEKVGTEDLKMIRIPMEVEISHYFPYGNVYLTVEFRQHIDYDRGIPEGVSLRLARLNDKYTSQTNLLRNIETTPSFILREGKSYTDNINGIKVTLLRIVGGGEDIVAEISVEQIDKEVPNFNNPIVLLDFNQPFDYSRDLRFGENIIGWKSKLENRIVNFPGGYVIGSEFYRPERREGGIYFNNDNLEKIESTPFNNGFIELNHISSYYMEKNNEYMVTFRIKLLSLPVEKALIYDRGLGTKIMIDNKGIIEIQETFSVENIDNGELFGWRIVESTEIELNVNEWYNIFLTYNGEELSIYTDGNSQTFIIPKLGGNNIIKGLSSYNRDSYIGGLMYIDSGLNGIVDDFKIYAKAPDKFIRGDLDGNGIVDISDPIGILNFVFYGRNVPDCVESADANDDGRTDISDAIFLLLYLFQGGEEPAEPFPDIGIDLTPDGLGC